MRFERIRGLSHALARAIMMMFVVTEVHPFIDGNGRTARLAMNCMLSAGERSRIIIPTVYREDYPPRIASRNFVTGCVINTVTGAWSIPGSDLHFTSLRRGRLPSRSAGRSSGFGRGD